MKIVNILMRVVISHLALIIINIISFIVSVACMIEATHLIGFNMERHTVDETEDIFSSINTLYVALAVFLEEVESISEMAKIKTTHFQERLNKICHNQGVGMLVLALFSELSVLIIKIPDRIFGVSHTQYIFFSISFIFIISVIFIQIALMFKLLLLWWSRNGDTLEKY